MSDLVAAIEHQERLATGYGSLQEDRVAALDHYMGRAYGDEQEGRSQVVMRDVHDTIEWIKPSLMKVFGSGDEVVRFNPMSPEDEEQSQQETDYVNHVLMSKNDGFMVMLDWFHDALLQKNGYVLVSAETEQRAKREQYKGLTDDEFGLLMQDKPEVIAHSAETTSEGQTLHSLIISKPEEYACLKVKNIPPERVLVASDWSSLNFKGCPFVEVVDYPTISDLRQQDYEVDDDISDEGGVQDDRWADRKATGTDTIDRDDIEADPTTRRVRTRYVWILFDEDGDGIAELRKIVIVGTTILENEEDDLIPIACLTPYRMPHEHYGQSVDDVVHDLQRIRTVLIRGFLDNMYLANNGRVVADVNRVNIDDLLTPRPGGVVRSNGDPNGAVMPFVIPQIGSDVLQAVEYVDTVRENRVGVTKYNQGLDANSLNKTASGVTQIMTAAQQRIELVARLFAETGVKHLMLIIHAMSLKNSRQAELVKLRNEWVPVDPRSWKSRYDVTVSVGLGTGNKDQMLQHLMLILQAQKEALPLGVATPTNVFNALTRLTQNAGFKQTEEFWTDPAMNPPQPQPNPEMMKAQAEMQSKQMDMQIKVQTSQADMQAKQQGAQIDLEKARVELQIKFAELEIKRQDLELRARSAALDHQVAQQRAVMQASDDMARAREINRDD